MPLIRAMIPLSSTAGGPGLPVHPAGPGRRVRLGRRVVARLECSRVPEVGV